MDGTLIHIACAADANYAPHAAAMMRSALTHNPPQRLRFHFMHSAELAPDVIGKLRGMVDAAGSAIAFHCIDPAAVAGLPEMGRISRVMWYRLFLPQRLAEIPRVLYLDCDTIVLDDLAPLWETDLSQHELGAIRNVFERGRERHVAALGLAEYFNSGVLLMNLAAWRERDTSAQVLAYARGNRLVWPDQDALNATLAGRWRALHPRWNCQNSLFYFTEARATFGADAVAEATRAPGILHFEGGELAKPWHYLCKHPYRQEYYRNLAGTPWTAQPPEGRTLRNMLLRQLPATWILPTLRLAERVQRRLARRKRI